METLRIHIILNAPIYDKQKGASFQYIKFSKNGLLKTYPNGRALLINRANYELFFIRKKWI